MIRKDLENFVKSIPENVTLVVATKYLNIDEMQELFDHNIRNYGENRVDSFLPKHAYFAGKNVIWHFIGHLQRNKAKKVINKIDYLHSLDSLELADIIEKERTTVLPVFIEVSINEEENKNGVKVQNLPCFVERLLQYQKIKLVGLMMMAKDHSSDAELHKQFRNLKIVQKQLEETFNINIPYLSMGMSNDYKIAIEEGATHIRLGRIISE